MLSLFVVVVFCEIIFLIWLFFRQSRSKKDSGVTFSPGYAPIRFRVVALLTAVFIYTFLFFPEECDCDWSLLTPFIPSDNSVLFSILHYLFIYHSTICFIHSVSLAYPSKFHLNLMFRIFISIPSSAFSAFSTLSFLPIFFLRCSFFIPPWRPVAVACVLLPILLVVLLLGIPQSLGWTSLESVHVQIVDGASISTTESASSPLDVVGKYTLMERVTSNSFIVRTKFQQKLHDMETSSRINGSFSFVQLSDIHMGTFMSPQKLREICDETVRLQPDFVFLTGDLMTMEGRKSGDLLSWALEPLKAHKRAFACIGNHDYECPKTVKQALESAGVRLLIDEWDFEELENGMRIQIVGVDDTGARKMYKARRHIKEFCSRLSEREESTSARIMLLHNPVAFKSIPLRCNFFVLSGHTHGGHLGLLSFGSPWTVIHSATGIPDHGLWRHGSNWLYVHRGTGFYGFPLRIGVPSERSIFRVYTHPTIQAGSSL